MGKIKIKDVRTAGTFIGWLEDEEGNLHNPKNYNIWIEN